MYLALKRVQERNKNQSYISWLDKNFPEFITAPMGERHKDLWEWIESIKPGERISPFVAVWPRGGAKSATAELGIVRIGAKRVRNYGWYVSSTQDKADMHVETIGGMLESPRLEKSDPRLAKRLVGKYGHSKGWRRNRLRTASGFTVDALGLDTGARGAKVDQFRPDFIVLDDFDEKSDSPATVLKKIQTITTTILPAGSNDVVVLVIQNVVHSDSVMSRLIDGRADFLADRIISGPFPAVENLEVEQIDGKFTITGGTPTWEGQNLEICQNNIISWGYTSFRQEAQHEVDEAGGIWEHIEWQREERDKAPKFIRTSVWVDPAVTSKDSSDCQGISAGGVTVTGKIYGLYWREIIDSPLNTIKLAIRKALEIGALKVGVETDQGGDTWDTVYGVAVKKVKKEVLQEIFTKLSNKYEPQKTKFKSEVKFDEAVLQKAREEFFTILWPKFTYDKAGAGYGSKVERNQRMLGSYENGEVFHVRGTHKIIEKALKRFPKAPLDVADSWFWVWNDLSGNSKVRLYSGSA